ncbi:MAG TPA: PqqD family peptide modification chaperone [Candidatus Dormibacteraeota bacterium]|nr:PqqD family peptide modification chaperone [Candidatus Dormibacteraeota bacterium]
MLYPPEGDGRALTDACTTAGRAPDNRVVVKDKFASRYHARIWREPGGYRLEDLDSMNGTFVNGERLNAGESRVLRDYDVIGIGPTSQLRIEQPRTTDIGSKTMISAPDTTMVALTGAVAESTPATGLDVKPRRRSGWALKQVPVQGTEARWVLRNTRTSAYLQLTDRDRFIWDQLDGEHSVRDLLLAYARQYGQLALPRIQQLLDQLSRAGLLGRTGEPDTRKPSPVDRVVAALLRAELAVSGIDGRMDRAYRAFGWRFFTRVGIAIVILLAIGGLLVFAVAARHARLFDVGGAGVVGVVAAIVAYVGALIVHEMAHALATKSFGRKVPRGGLMLMMGMPYAFVDTTDMWLEGRGPRIMVSLAGPVATAALTAFFAAGAALLPSPVAAGVCFQVAFALYINTLFNFNPLIPLDGYYALSDWLEMPRLREEASAYFRKGLWRDLSTRQPMGRRQLGMAVYGMFAVVGMFLFILLGIFSWTSRLGRLVHDHVPAPFDTAILAAGLLLVFFPVWYFPLIKIVRSVRRRARREVGSVELGSQPA